MVALRATGIGYDRIAAQMNAEGIETRTRGRWPSVVTPNPANGGHLKTGQ
jgi:hypothetical protein